MSHYKGKHKVSSPVDLFKLGWIIGIICMINGVIGCGPNETELIDAVRINNIKEVRRIIQEGIEVDELKNGTAAILVAASNANFEIVETLLEYGANPNLSDENGKTPLMLMVETSENDSISDKLLETATLLIRKGADVNSKDKYGETALIKAVLKNNSDLIYLLLNNNADPSIKRNDNETALTLTTIKKQFESSRIFEIWNKAKKNSFDLNDELISAAKNGYTVILKILLDRGIKLDVKRLGFTSTIGEEALLIATKKGHTPIIEILIENDVYIDVKDSKGVTPLMVASDGTHLYFEGSGIPPLNISTVKLLLKKGANVNNVDDQGRTAIMLAVQEILERDQIVKLLLEYGADINKKDSKGWTALMHASNYGDTYITSPRYYKGGPDIHKESADIVKLLVQNGANVNVVNDEGKTALIIASERGHSLAIRELIRKGANIEFKIQKGSKYNWNEGFTAVMVAAYEGHLNALNELILNGADLNVKDKREETTLMYISRKGVNQYGDILNILLKNGADVNIQNEQGKTALMNAVGEADYYTVKMLLANGANIDIKDNNGRTALMIAKKLRNNRGVVTKLLLENEAGL